MFSTLRCILSSQSKKEASNGRGVSFRRYGLADISRSGMGTVSNSVIYSLATSSSILVPLIAKVGMRARSSESTRHSTGASTSRGRSTPKWYGDDHVLRVVTDDDKTLKIQIMSSQIWNANTLAATSARLRRAATITLYGDRQRSEEDEESSRQVESSERGRRA
ncbi:hypothetical protein K438DRAFT_1769984 [Mycena galopus ATCC 62051]|nr:hypothetical protein K438DRAFT_1769984 [Mycena galopus ATCC 62051]